MQAALDLELLLQVLPATIRQPLMDAVEARQDAYALLEIVTDLGRAPTARFVDGEVEIRTTEVTQAEIDEIVHGISEFDDDNRSGITRTLHRIAAIRNRRGDIVGLTCRVGRAVYGTVDIIEDIVEEGNSVLLLGRPGVGKTTMLREMARILSERKRVIIVDTSNEIGGDGNIPHPAVGRARRMQVPRPSHQHETMIEAVENHNPEVIIIDEIGRELEAQAARTINERGVQLIATAHGNSLENLLLNPTLSDLVGGIESVTLSDEEAKRRGTQKTVLERRAPPTFAVLIEIQGRQNLVIHRDVAGSVDAMLRGRASNVEVRSRDDTGIIEIQLAEHVSDVSSIAGRRRDGDDGDRPRRNGRSKRDKGDGSRREGTLVVRRDGEDGEGKGSGAKRLRVYSFGVARNRLMQAARRLGVFLEIVDSLDDAEVMVTLKSYYRKQRKLVADAESRRIPVFVLRANTVVQMEGFLADALGLGTVPNDPFEAALAEATEAIKRVQGGEPRVDLAPVGAAMRRYQHQMARQANLVSHSYGQEPRRFVRIFATPRNEVGEQPTA